MDTRRVSSSSWTSSLGLKRTCVARGLFGVKGFRNNRFPNRKSTRAPTRGVEDAEQCSPHILRCKSSIELEIMAKFCSICPGHLSLLYLLRMATKVPASATSKVPASLPCRRALPPGRHSGPNPGAEAMRAENWIQSHPQNPAQTASFSPWECLAAVEIRCLGLCQQRARGPPGCRSNSTLLAIEHVCAGNPHRVSSSLATRPDLILQHHGNIDRCAPQRHILEHHQLDITLAIKMVNFGNVLSYLTLHPSQQVLTENATMAVTSYSLPQLPYAYDVCRLPAHCHISRLNKHKTLTHPQALEPYLSTQIMTLHHSSASSLSSPVISLSHTQPFISIITHPFPTSHIYLSRTAPLPSPTNPITSSLI